MKRPGTYLKTGGEAEGSLVEPDLEGTDHAAQLLRRQRPVDGANRTRTKGALAHEKSLVEGEPGRGEARKVRVDVRPIGLDAVGSPGCGPFFGAQPCQWRRR